jgi:D-glycero-alpha-D-manno-heptose-7-phosphate kinase
MYSTLKYDLTIRDALLELKRTGIGITCVIRADGYVLGVLSDGDLRKALLNGFNLLTSINNVMNSNFIFAYENESRESLIKKFDQKIHIIPILDKNFHLVKFIKSIGPVRFSNASYARAKAPGRISLAGGGTDFTKYFIDADGCGLSVSLSKFAHATLKIREDDKVNIYSRDFDQYARYKTFKEVGNDQRLSLITEGIKLLKPEFGFDLEVGSDFPPGSGLGGSASILASLAGVFRELMDKKLTKKEIAEFAFQAERLELGIPGGWQDQYATVFGGFNYLEFKGGPNSVLPLRLEDIQIKELEERLILCYTGKVHKGEKIQSLNIKTDNKNFDILKIKSDLKIIVVQMREAILDDDYNKIGSLLSASWELKKRANPLTSNVLLNNIYKTAMENGAIGGRLLGTGGGGFFVFMTDVGKKFELCSLLNKRGFQVESVNLDQKGLTSWKF